MLRYVTLLSLVSALSAHADIATIQADINRFYTNVPQGSDDQTVWHSGREPFQGDCDDYATAVASRLAQQGTHWRIYQVETRIRMGGKQHRIPHVVTCGLLPEGELCMGSEKRKWFEQGRYHRKWKLLAQSVD